MAIIKIVPFPGPKGDTGAQGPSGSGGSGLENVKSQVWGYPSELGVAISPSTSGESIALKSQSSAALRWHIRDNSPSLAWSAPITPTSATVVANGQAFDVTFTFPELDGMPAIDYHYSIASTNEAWAGSYLATAATTTSITFTYPSDPGTFDAGYEITLGQPSVYNQVEADSQGVWIKNANWSEDPTSVKYWKFGNSGQLDAPYQSSNARTGSGSTLKIGNTTNQTIITGMEPDAGNPTAQRLVIAGQDGYTDGSGNYEYSEGGDVYLWAGRGSGQYGTGGDIKVDAGNAISDGEGGTVKVRGGGSVNGNGGFVEITAGSSSTGLGGPVYVSAGSSSGNAGTVTINGGMSYGANGGNVNISAGFSYAQGYSAGSVQINAPMDGKVLINGGGGEFINDANDANNQIATVGNVAAVTASGVTGSFTSQDGKLITVTNGIITGIEVV